MPGVPTLTALVPQQIHPAETRRAVHLRLLRGLRDFHRRVNAACDGLAGLVHADACAKAKVGRDTGRHTGTHPSGATIGSTADSQYLGAGCALADRRDLYQKLETLGVDRDLLAIVGSWGDSLYDEEVLALLKDWNAVERNSRN
jgi:hypothetical protein